MTCTNFPNLGTYAFEDSVVYLAMWALSSPLHIHFKNSTIITFLCYALTILVAPASET